MHTIHAQCFAKGWSEEEFKSMLDVPGTFAVNADGKGFILCRTVLDETEILTLCVLPDYRRQGVASFLLAEAFRRAVGTRFFLEVNENNRAALALYSKMGFEVVGKRKKYYNNKDDAFIMRKDNV